MICCRYERRFTRMCYSIRPPNLFRGCPWCEVEIKSPIAVEVILFLWYRILFHISSKIWSNLQSFSQEVFEFYLLVGRYTSRPSGHPPIHDYAKHWLVGRLCKLYVEFISNLTVNRWANSLTIVLVWFASYNFWFLSYIINYIVETSLFYGNRIH